MKALALLLLATPCMADPFETVMTNDQGAILDIYGVTDGGFNFTLSSAPCPEGETTCLVIEGQALATAKGYTWSDGNSRIFFADTAEGVTILQTAGDLGAGTANRAAKLAFPGDYVPDAEAAEQMGDPGDGDMGVPPSFSLFQTPTGNIGCQFIAAEATEVRCDLGEYTASYPNQPNSCEFDWGGAFGVTSWSDVGEVLCYSDTVRDPGAEVLDYGAKITVGDVTCWSEKTGVICENSMGHGFQISRRAQEVY
ncbi:hypothetical protein NX862_03850 [Rhodobacter sp. KR11]|uniref:DUF6636 domain-containing protein n=1 Tax=Rhodobacter sp. KR11 TaxID=2974588 RepID=UPI002223A85C|nr:DUF6636 domain-containing protein [Rhodobacter sp. KR11]MCW1917876.1 hypothetical protein [Rhodobacter sp. KR11]